MEDKQEPLNLKVLDNKALDNKVLDNKVLDNKVLDNKVLDTIPWQQSDVLKHVQRLLRSFHHWTGRSLLDAEGTPADTAQKLFEAPFVIVSHGTQPDPILNYGNRKALELWEMNWEQFTQTPSRCTAEPIERQERFPFTRTGKNERLHR